MMSKALTILGTEIQQLIATAERLAESAIEHALQAGDKLIQAKEQTAHGQWLPFLSSIELIAKNSATLYAARLQSRKAGKLLRQGGLTEAMRG